MILFFKSLFKFEFNVFLSVVKSLIFPILYYIIYGSIIYGEFRIKKKRRFVFIIQYLKKGDIL